MSPPPVAASPPEVRLRRPEASDLGHYRALYASPEVMRHVGAPLPPAAIAAQWQRVLRHNGLDAPGHRVWMVDATLRGAGSAPCGIAALRRAGTRAEFGILLLPFAWGRGVATAAIQRLLPDAFGPLGLDAIDASRPDDAHVPVIDRLFAPFGFERAPGLRAGEVGWCLTRAAWAAGADSDGRHRSVGPAMP